MAARSVRYAKGIITSNYFISETSSDPIYKMAHDYKPCEEEIYPPLWAHCQGHGKLYDKIYFEKYQNDIKQMFEIGEANSSEKMDASKMREQLMLKYPNKFSLPGEIEIKKKKNRSVCSETKRCRTQNYHNKKMRTQATMAEES